MLIKCTHISFNLKIGCKVDQIYADSKNLATRDVPNPSNLYLITFNYTDLAEKKREFLCSWQNTEL